MNLHSLLRGNRARANAFNKLSSRFFFTFFFFFFFFLKRTHFRKECEISPSRFPVKFRVQHFWRTRKERENGEEDLLAETRSIPHICFQNHTLFLFLQSYIYAHIRSPKRKRNKSACRKRRTIVIVRGGK